MAASGLANPPSWIVAAIRRPKFDCGWRQCGLEADRAGRRFLADVECSRILDDELNPLSPDWPLHRQPVLDRSTCPRRPRDDRGPGQWKVYRGRRRPEFSTKESPRFINGVLDRLQRERQRNQDQSGEADHGIVRRATEALRSGLTKTRTALTGVLGALAGRKIDEEALQTIEASLLRADVGPALSTSLVESLRTAWRQGSVMTGESRDHLAQDLGERLGAPWEHHPPNKAPPFSWWWASMVPENHQHRQAGQTVFRRRKVACRRRHLPGRGRAPIGGVGRRLGVDIIKGKEGADPAAVAWDGAEVTARNADFLIVDTAGRLHVQED